MIKKEPFFSVITAMKNGRNYLSSYVEVLKQQDFQNWEAIVIDDGSTDGNIQLLDNYISGDIRFHIAIKTRSKNIPGPYQAHNHGLQVAKGEWICFLDIDDAWLPNKLKYQALILQAHPKLKILYSNYWRVQRYKSFGNKRTQPPLLALRHLIAIANPVPMLTACIHNESAKITKFQAINHKDYIYCHTIGHLEKSYFLA